jgi:hypothetical protein
MSERWVVEGYWSGYTSSQRRVVHRDVVSKRMADRLREMSCIEYTDGTRLDLFVFRAKPRERVAKINGYGKLIGDCLTLGTNRVSELEVLRARRQAEFRAKFVKSLEG